MRIPMPGLPRWLVLLALPAALLAATDVHAADKSEALSVTPPEVVRALKRATIEHPEPSTPARLGTAAIRPSVAPSNDDFANAEVLAGAAGTATGSNVDATAEPGEPEHDFNGAFNSIWYTITPASDGVLVIDTFGSDFDTVLAAYTGSTVDGLTPIASNDEAGFSSQSRIGFPAMAGVTYAIAVDGFEGDEGVVALNFVVQDPAPNDDFDNAIALEGLAGAVDGDNLGATSEPGEPTHAGVGGGASVWYTFDPSQTGCAIFDALDSEFDTVLAVYTGDSVDMLSEVGSTDEGVVGFFAEPGTTYRIAVDGFEGDRGFFTLNFIQTDDLPPANDDFANATRLSGNDRITSDDNICATSEAGEPEHALFGGTSSVWYQIRTARDRVVTLDTFRSDLDTNISVYTGRSVDDLTLVADSDIAGEALQSQVAFLAMGGTTYHIAVDGFFGDQGSFDLRLDIASDLPPTNDDVEDALELTGRSGSVVGDNRDATQQPIETWAEGTAEFFFIGGTRSVWYRFQPTRDGVTFLDTFGSDFDTALFVYEGDPSVENISAFNDNAGERQSSLAFLAEAGTTYHIAVDGTPRPNDQCEVVGDQGDLRLNFRQSNRRTPPNDDFEDATPLAGASGSVSGFNIGATEQAGEPTPALDSTAGRSVWWRWRAPFTGLVSFTTARSGFDTVLTVWRGGSLLGLEEVASNDDADLQNASILQSLVTFAAEEGQLYAIEVDGFDIEVDGFDDLEQGSIGLAYAPGRIRLKADVLQLADQKGADRDPDDEDGSECSSLGTGPGVPQPLEG